MRNSILVIEPELSARQTLYALLSRQGYEVCTAATLAEGLQLFGSVALRAILLELDLPDADGLELIDHVRRRSNIGILVVSNRRAEQDKVSALDRGANDHISKPFRPEELLARLRVALRTMRLAPGAQGIEVGALSVRPIERRVYLRGKEVPLTPTEFSLLHVMARQAGRVLTHRQLLRDVWGSAKRYDSNYLRVFMYQLRRKLEQDPNTPRLLLTTPRIGYRLMPA